MGVYVKQNGKLVSIATNTSGTIGGGFNSIAVGSDTISAEDNPQFEIAAGDGVEMSVSGNKITFSSKIYPVYSATEPTDSATGSTWMAPYSS